MKKEFFETLVKDSRERAIEQVSVEFGDLHELNQCVNAYNELLKDFSCNSAKTGCSKDFWEGITLLQLHLENALEQGIINCQKSK